MIDLSERMSDEALDRFVAFINKISGDIGFKVSSRGWGYILEQRGIITKDQFDKVESVINRCRKNGKLPVDFVAEESSRAFHEIHEPTEYSHETHIAKWLNAALNCHTYFEPDWWDGEDYYIQMVVEKIDLVTLFQPICREFHIPIANSKGWSSILQRAEYCRRFKEAEDRGLRCVLLYCGDHDPDGLRISETLRKNLLDVSLVRWKDGEDGYDPNRLQIERFGLNYDFIVENDLTWIDNLITGSGKDLASPTHPNHEMPYVKNYLRNVGERKCEANAIVVVPDMGRELCRQTILRVLGEDAESRFAARRSGVNAAINKKLRAVGVDSVIKKAIKKLAGAR